MIITRTPFRISFFGGGTDYPCYYSECGGGVLAASINKYCYISVRRLPQFFDYRHRIVWSKTELVHSIDEIVHPSVRECLRFLDIDEGLEIHHDGDLPARSGLGSSSSFTVGLLNALYGLNGRLVSNLELAEKAIYVEQNMIKENVGSQDQTITAFGGINTIRFNCCQDQHISVEPLCLTQDRIREFESHLMLFFTGTRRVASDIAEEQIRQTPNRKLELSEMLKLVDEAARVLQGTRNIADIGQMLHETWMLKRSLTHKISNSIIDDIYNSARRLGAIGGKLLGAGGGGFILFFVSPEDRQHVEERLGLLHVPFGFEFRGSHIIFFDPMTETRFSPRVVGREVENFEANAIRKRAYENK